MLWKILRKDIQRNRLITLVVFCFIALSAMLVASGFHLILTLGTSLETLTDRAALPHFVQMHAGAIDQAQIDRWTRANELVESQQTVEMLTINGSSLFLGGSTEPETDTVMDIGFVVQNQAFDYLLDLDNEIISVGPGEIAVPIYFMKAAGLQDGDKVAVRTDSADVTFTIVDFVRDAQMNPAIVHSKRFVIHPTDYAYLKDRIEDVEYLVEFRLLGASRIDEFRNEYRVSDLPKRGEAVDAQIFKVLNGLTDGLLAGVVLLLSILIIAIALLCLRFTILATLEEDYREIGILKGIGSSRSDIRRIYLVKYVTLGVTGSTLGYIASIWLNQVLSRNITLYFGTPPRNLAAVAIPFIAAGGILMIVLASCYIVIGRFNRVNAVEALRSGSMGVTTRYARLLCLSRGGAMNLNIYLGLRDIVQRFRLYWLLGVVYFFCAVVVIIPVHFLSTIQSPTFITYMGIGRSNLRIDPRPSGDIWQQYDSVTDYLADDPDVHQFAPYVTAQYTAIQEDGSEQLINIESGDYSIFPLRYMAGGRPAEPDEIALSILNAQELEKQVGDDVIVMVDGEAHSLHVTGIYQDITHGGRTAKATLTPDLENVLWFTVSVDLVPGAQVELKVREYAAMFEPARITDIEGYISQTMGNTVRQMQTATWITALVGLFVAILITSLFLRMLISKDTNQIAIQRGLGFSLQNIRLQYLTTTLFLVSVGISAGTIFANTAGQALVSALLANFGASQVSFVVDPLLAYAALPLALLGTVSVTTMFNLTAIQADTIATKINE